MPIEVNGKTFETDEQGYLANLNEREPDMSTVMAKDNHCDPTVSYWEVINFLREYYDEYQYPLENGGYGVARDLCRYLVKQIR